MSAPLLKTKKRLKIAFLHKALIFGGAERLILDLGLSAVKQGHEVTFLTSEYNPKRVFNEFSTTPGITVKVATKKTRLSQIL